MHSTEKNINLRLSTKSTIPTACILRMPNSRGSVALYWSCASDGHIILDPKRSCEHPHPSKSCRLPPEAYCNEPPGDGEYSASASLVYSDDGSCSGVECVFEDAIVQVQIGSSGCSIAGLPSLQPASYSPDRGSQWSLTFLDTANTRI